MVGFTFSASDILKALDSLPLWKSLVTLPKRVAELEARLTALEEGKAANAAPEATQCPKCGARLVFQNEYSDRTMGALGMKTHEFLCDGCGFQTERRWHAQKGYC